LRQAIPTTESAAIASCLIGLARAHLARREHSEAIANAERALALQEALVPPNETSVAMTLALLGNIYEDFGDSTHALVLCTKALILFERTLPANLAILAELLRNLGTIQSRFETLADAQHSLERSVKIYGKVLPRGHQERVSAENELRRIVQLRQKNKENSVQQEYLNGDTFC
jgi:tetratricopeptide (TPR) repeat protein